MKAFFEKLNLKWLAILLVVFAASCETDDPTNPGDGETLEEQNERIKSIISKNTVKTNLIVKVEDTKNDLQSGAEVTVAGKTNTTNADGYVVFENIILNEHYAFITVKKAGFEKAMKTITPSKNGITNVDVMLLDDVAPLELDAAQGGELKTQDVTLDFPANAIADESGNPYTGKVNVNIVHYGIDDANFAQTQPGILVGITNDNNEAGLISEGMISVDLTDASGRPLNIAKDKKVKIKMPASAEGPQEVIFWYLNETYGLWVETGKAVKNGDIYETEVSHFSTYNLDWRFDNPVNFCVRFNDKNGKPISNERVKVKYRNGMERYTITDNVGEICFTRGCSASEYQFIIDIGGCGEVITTLDITESKTYEVEVDLNEENYTIFEYSGSLVGCNGEPLPNKFFFLEVEGMQEIFKGYSDDAGNYKITNLECGKFSGAKNAKLVVIENDGKRENEFSISLSQPVLFINLYSCAPITPFGDNTPLLFKDNCFEIGIARQIGVKVNYNSENQTYELERPIKYGEVKNLKQIGMLTCQGVQFCNTFDDLKYFISVEEIAFAYNFDSTDTDFDFTDFKQLKKLKKVDYRDVNGFEVKEKFEEILPDVEFINNFTGC